MDGAAEAHPPTKSPLTTAANAARLLDRTAGHAFLDIEDCPFWVRNSPPEFAVALFVGRREYGA